MWLLLFVTVSTALQCTFTYDVSFGTTIYAGDQLRVIVDGFSEPLYDYSVRISTQEETTDFLPAPDTYYVRTSIYTNTVTVTAMAQQCNGSVPLETEFDVYPPTCKLLAPKRQLNVRPQDRIEFTVATRGASSVVFSTEPNTKFFGFGAIVESYSNWIGYYTVTQKSTVVAAWAYNPQNASVSCFAKPVHLSSVYSVASQLILAAVICSIPVLLSMCLCFFWDRKTTKQWITSSQTFSSFNTQLQRPSRTRFSKTSSYSRV